MIEYSTCAEDVASFRDAQSKAWDKYVQIKNIFIDRLSLKQYSRWQKLQRDRSYRNQNNTINWSKFPIEKVTTSNINIQYYNRMIEYYNDYLVYAMRSEIKLVA